MYTSVNVPEKHVYKQKNVSFRSSGLRWIFNFFIYLKRVNLMTRTNVGCSSKYTTFHRFYFTSYELIQWGIHPNNTKNDTARVYIYYIWINIWTCHCRIRLHHEMQNDYHMYIFTSIKFNMFILKHTFLFLNTFSWKNWLLISSITES